MFKRRAQALLFIIGSLAILFFMVTAFFYFAQKIRLNRLVGYSDKTIATYLCESAISLALVAYFKHNVSKGTVKIPYPYQFSSGSYGGNFSYDGFSPTPKIYDVSFVVSNMNTPGVPLRKRVANVYIKACVNSPFHLGRKKYCLEAATQRAFPFFIQGRP